MNDNLIITIGRQFGSGGREIGKRLADLFGIAYYDKELIKLASEEYGATEAYRTNTFSNFNPTSFVI